ncbi:MAG: hypothetical protein EAZ78_23570 [Oscillatoriales cyanobacterium]|nr:MAG: hypothetical protein EAZ78_23570 [Oscillatoriales cyanobacterium]TAF70462.1 MAG: hypothetical protein EAZ59_04625 [Oscillatoriales cyanobacterium]
MRLGGRVYLSLELPTNIFGETRPYNNLDARRGGFHRQSLRKTHNLNKPARPNQGLGGRVYLSLELPTNIFGETRPYNQCISMLVGAGFTDNL